MSLQNCQGPMVSTVYINLWVSLFFASVVLKLWKFIAGILHYFISIQQDNIVNLTHTGKYLLMFHKIHKLLLAVDFQAADKTLEC